MEDLQRFGSSIDRVSELLNGQVDTIGTLDYLLASNREMRYLWDGRIPEGNIQRIVRRFDTSNARV